MPRFRAAQGGPFEGQAAATIDKSSRENLPCAALEAEAVVSSVLVRLLERTPPFARGSTQESFQ
nr:MAG: hypothetical protein DIU78_25280 [Pseudomonadota bacterium]